MLKLIIAEEQLLAGTEDKFLSANDAFQRLVPKIHRMPAASRQL
jgi:hypothetical protein